MSGVSDPVHSTETQNGTVDKEGKAGEDNLLLQKLLEQNRLLEEDHRFLSHTSRPGSTSDSTSMHSADSVSSLRNSTSSHDHKHSLSPILSSGTLPLDSPLLHSPTEVRRKPLLPTSYEYTYEDTESDEEGLGPGACILLDDEYGTKIDYDEVVPVGGSPQEVVSPEVGVAELDEMEGSGRVARSLSPPTRGMKKVSTVTSTSDITLILQDDEGGSKEQECDEGNKDPKAVAVGNNRVQEQAPVPIRRFRSDTEPAKRISLSTLVGSNRKRTLTVVEGAGASPIKEEPEGVKQEEVPERTAEEEQWQKWSELLRNWEDSVKKKWTLIKQLVRQGIPDPLRGIAWQLLSGAHNLDLKEQYPALIIEDSPFQRAIRRDLNRTFPEHSFFKESDGLGQEGLMNILKAYSLYDKEVGYCQGSPFITGLLLMKMPEEEAFCVFVKLMKDYRLRDLFKPSMADLSLCFYIFEKFLEELYPDLYTHFRAVGFQTSMYASPWFLTMFSSVLSLDVVFRIMDIFLVDGREIVFRVGLALIEHNLDRLVRGDLEEILKYFQKEIRAVHEGDPDTLIQRALKIKLSHKKMKKLEKEYLSRKEKEALEGKEIARLQSDNSHLTHRVSALEKECASLADRLIQGQVTLAENAEEKFVLKKKLSVAERKLATLDKPEPLGEGEGGKLVVGVESEAVKVVDGVTVVEGVMEDNLGPNEHYIVIKTPVHVCKEEVEEALRQLSSGSPVLSSRSSQSPLLPPSHPMTLPISGETADSAGEMPTPDTVIPKGKKSKLKKRLTNKFSHKSDQDPKQKYRKNKDGDTKLVSDGPLGSPDVVEGCPVPSPALSRKAHKRKKSKSLSGDLTFELAQVKIQCADTAHQLEHKSLELNKALHREEFVVRELKEAREHIMRLEQKLFDLSTCPQCGHMLQSEKLNFELTDSSYTSPTEEGADSAVLSQVRQSVSPPSEGGGEGQDSGSDDR